MAKVADLMGLGMPPGQADQLGFTPMTSAGAGTAQAGATLIGSNLVTGTTSGGATAFVLPGPTRPWGPIWFTNSSSTAALVYPDTGAAIDNNSANSSVSVVQYETRAFIRTSTTQWISLRYMAGGSNGFTINAGTATQAPIVLTAGTNLTTPAAGAEEFDGTAFYATSVASSRQVVDTEQFICLASNYTASDTASAQKVFNSPTNGALTVAALTSYFFEADYTISNTGTTSHTWATLFGGTATFTSIAYTAMARTGTTSAATITALSSLQAAAATAVVVTAASTSATEFVTVRLRGIMRINAAGTVIPQIQASAQPGATGTPGVTVLAGSFFRLWPVGSNTVASVGNWA